MDTQHPLATYRLTAPNLPGSAKVARDMVAALLDVSGQAGLADSARLLVSEVVSNVHLHTKVPRFRLDAAVVGGAVRVSVEDGEPQGRPAAAVDPTAVREDAVSGRGVLLVQACASRWGTTWWGSPEPVAKRVWFELRD